VSVVDQMKELTQGDGRDLSKLRLFEDIFNVAEKKVMGELEKIDNGSWDAMNVSSFVDTSIFQEGGTLLGPDEKPVSVAVHFFVVSQKYYKQTQNSLTRINSQLTCLKHQSSLLK
jgi:hypothetical protein